MIPKQNKQREFNQTYKYSQKHAEDIFDIKYIFNGQKQSEQQPRQSIVKVNQPIVKIHQIQRTENKVQKIENTNIQQKVSSQKVQQKEHSKRNNKKNKRQTNIVMSQNQFNDFTKYNKINKKKFNYQIQQEQHDYKNKNNKKYKKNTKKQRQWNTESDEEELDQIFDLLLQEQLNQPKRSKSSNHRKNKQYRNDNSHQYNNNRDNTRDNNKDYKKHKNKISYEDYIDIEDIEESRTNGENKYYKGFVEFHERLKNFAKILTKQIEGEFIAEGINKNRCIHGDQVYFQIINDKEQKTKCKIVAILPWKGKGIRNIVGKVQLRRDKNALYLIPINKRIYTFDIKFNKIDKATLQKSNQKYFLAEIIGWQKNKEYPQCKVIKQFGELGDIQTQTHALLINNGVVDQEYDEQTIHNGLAKFIQRADQNGEYKISQEQIAKRKDLRKQRIFTIDPLTARDFDDALSIQLLGNKNNKKIYQIGVHIADASYFVQQNGPIDQLAQRKTTSVYLVHRVIPMLPRILCETMCSLNPGLQRLTLSVWFKISEDGQIQDGCRYDKTVIRSQARFTYQQAQSIIENKISSQQQIQPGFGCGDSKHFKSIAEDIKIMNSIAMKLRKNRIDGGSLIFQIPKKTFKLDQNLYPESYTINQRFEAHFLVQQYMLLANQKVGQILVNHIGSSALLRKHKFPGPKKIAKFQTFTKRINQKIDISPQVKIQEQINKVLKDPTVKSSIKSILNHQLIFLLEMAEYFVIGDSKKSQWLHYALNMPVYTHFTSPIRRYPDIIVHRQLCAIIEAEKSNNSKQLQIPHYHNLKQLVQRCNQNKMSAKKVSSGCQKIFLCLYLKKNPVNCKAVITDMNQHCINVSVPSYDLRSTIQMKELKKMKMLSVRLDKQNRKIMDSEAQYQVNGQIKKMKFFLKQLQQIDVRLSGKEGFPIDYQLRVVLPNPNKPGQNIYLD